MSECEKIESYLWDYPDIPREQREQVSAHLETCESCREALETIESLRQSRKADRAAISKIDTAAFDDAVMRKIQSRKEAVSPVSDNRKYIFQMAVSVGLAAAIVIFMMMSISDLSKIPAFKLHGESDETALDSNRSIINIRLAPRSEGARMEMPAVPKMAKKAPPKEEFSILLNPVTTPSPDSVNIDAVYLTDETVPTMSQQARASVSEIVSDTGMVQAVKIPTSTLVTVEKMPKPVDMVPPEYPVWAKKLGLSGIVWIKARVDENGKVTDAKVISSSTTGAGFEEAALKAARLSTYSPAESNGMKLPVWVMYPVKFIYKN